MANGFFNVPTPTNEVIKSYQKGSPEREELIKEITKRKAKQIDIPMIINGRKIRTKNKIELRPPHEHQHILGQFNRGDKNHIQKAIDAAMKAKENWANMDWQHRAAIFLKAADLIAGPYRKEINAATMLGQSKNVYQAEIDSACELIDFLRFNVAYMTQIYGEQPISDKGIWNQLEYRPLEGFVFAITPFNFTAIAGNLCAAPALMGNTVVWKPAETQIYAAQVIMEIFMEAGLPDGVINLIFVNGPDAGEVVFKNEHFAGLHFTGSTTVFNQLWKTIGDNLTTYKSYPRIVGETGGKDFIVAHPSAHAKEVSTAIIRGSFEFQGQKCSAASRVYLPDNLWSKIDKHLAKDLEQIKMGSVEDFGNFVNAVISEASFDKIKKYIDGAKRSKNAKVIYGGKCDKKEGYFIEPTIILTKDPHYVTMEEEIFGPVVTIYVYQSKDFEKTLDLINSTSAYALTGAIFSKERSATILALKKLKDAAGNFYINDKPTGAVVGQQPFGGARKSGTNDKAGSVFNLLRWVSPRTIKETFVPPTDFGYPFME